MPSVEGSDSIAEQFLKNSEEPDGLEFFWNFSRNLQKNLLPSKYSSDKVTTGKFASNYTNGLNFTFHQILCFFVCGQMAAELFRSASFAYHIFRNLTLE